MPDIGKVQTTNFPGLLARMGINRNQIPFALRSEVIPVALVDSSVDFLASPNPAYRVTEVFTAGEVVAPAAGTVLADTGPLPIGGYTLKILIFPGEANNFRLQWRDSVNGADLLSILFRVNASLDNVIFDVRFRIEVPDERFRILNSAAGNVGIVYQAVLGAAI